MPVIIYWWCLDYTTTSFVDSENRSAVFIFALDMASFEAELH